MAGASLATAPLDGQTETPQIPWGGIALVGLGVFVGWLIFAESDDDFEGTYDDLDEGEMTAGDEL